MSDTPELHINQIPPPHTVQFFGLDGKQTGCFDFSASPVTFTGDADASATVFVENVIGYWTGLKSQLAAVTAERDGLNVECDRLWKAAHDQLCEMQDNYSKLQAELDALQRSIQDLSHPNCKMLLTERDAARAAIGAARKDQP